MLSVLEFELPVLWDIVCCSWKSAAWSTIRDIIRDMLYSSRKNLQHLPISTYLGSKGFWQVNALSLSIWFWKALFIGFVFVKSFSQCLRYFLNSAFLGEKFPDSDSFSSPAHTEAKNPTIAAGHSNLNMINI